MASLAAWIPIDMLYDNNLFRVVVNRRVAVQSDEITRSSADTIGSAGKRFLFTHRRTIILYYNNVIEITLEMGTLSTQ